MKRRQFLYFSVGASALGVAGVALPVVAGAPSIRIHRAVHDDRYAESVDFAREAADLGIPVNAIQGDITRFWFEELSLAWRERPVATAGLTNEDSLFCLEQLARDHRMRLVFRESRGELVSWVLAPVMGAVS